MKKYFHLLYSLLLSHFLIAQDIHIGLFGGLSAYNGDLTESIFPKKVTNGAIGVTASYELTDNILIRGGLTYSVVGGADRFNKNEDLRLRNLSFETSILELSAVGEYYLLNLYNNKISPYVMGGLAVYKFNPYTYNAANAKVFLKPLSTEGQGLPGYPNSKEYKLTQLAIPFGGGIKYAINENIRIGLELGLRILFTDHLDDVSGNYVDQADLLAAKGQIAVDFSYRGDEVSGGSLTYPTKGAQRGSPDVNDYYYFTGLHLTYRLPGKNNISRRNRNGCPVNIY